MYLPTGWTSLVHGDIFVVQSSQGGAPAVAEAAINSGAARSWSLGRRCVMLYPEGGFFRKRHPRSVEWLKKQDAVAVHPKFTALPRSGGFRNILGVVKQDFEGVLDITIRYEQGGACAPELPALFMGTEHAVYLDAQWIMKQEVPAPSDVNAVHEWLTRQFARKDDLMTSSPALYKPLSSVRGLTVYHCHCFAPYSHLISQVVNTAFHLGVHVPVFLMLLCCSYALGGWACTRVSAAALCFVAACLLTHKPSSTLIAFIIASVVTQVVIFSTSE
jgi:hypothetical protein